MVLGSWQSVQKHKEDQEAVKPGSMSKSDGRADSERMLWEPLPLTLIGQLYQECGTWNWELIMT